MKKAYKLTPEDRKELRILKAEGIKTKDLAKKFNVTPDTIYYHTNPHTKKRIREFAVKWNKDNRQKINASRLAYFREHRDIQYTQMFFSMLKLCLRKGWITKEQIIQKIEAMKE